MRVVSGMCVCVFLCSCHFKIALSSSFSSNKERCHVFTRLRSPLAGLPSPPSFTPACSALLHVRAYLLFQDSLLGFTKKGPGKIVDLSFFKSTSSCFCLVHKLPC
uniref:Secreted protein n=1 Tax=Theropithecus gelada TaxID=9565 RepID=A0A8D2G599_THEGE